jgi:hypothetical protein
MKFIPRLPELRSSPGFPGSVLRLAPLLKVMEMTWSRRKQLSFPEADIPLPNHLTTYLLIKPNLRFRSGDIGMALSKIPGVDEVHMTAGRFGFLVKMRTKTREQSEKAAKRLLLSPQISELDALIVPRTFVE